LPLPVAFLKVFFLTPFVRPWSFSQLFWTYVIPVLPLVIAWDGVASNGRTYSKEDLEELVRDLNDERYTWEISRVRRPFYPTKMMYFLGLPKVIE
jgi:hypothetical protein